MLYSRTRRTCTNYDLIAEWYSTDRGRTVGVAEALALAATLSRRRFDKTWVLPDIERT